jgi:hypothetical protein
MERKPPSLCLAISDEPMHEGLTKSIRESYDRVADEYARKIFNELEHKPLDRALLDRFAAETATGKKSRRDG